MQQQIGTKSQSSSHNVHKALRACLWIIVLESIDHNIHLHWKFLRKEKHVISVNVGSGNKLILSQLLT